MKLLAEDLQRLSPETVSLIDEETGAYKELDDSINSVIDSMRRKGIEQAKQNTMQGHYDNITKYSQKQIEAEKEFMEFQKVLYDNGFTDEDFNEYEKGNDGKISAALEKDYDTYIGVIGDYAGALEKRNKVIEKWQKKIDEEQAELDSVDTAFSSLYGDLLSGQPEQPSYTLGGENYKSSAQMAAEEYARNYTATMQAVTQEVADAQSASTEALKSGWESLNHAYAMGVIASDMSVITSHWDDDDAVIAFFGNTLTAMPLAIVVNYITLLLSSTGAEAVYIVKTITDSDEPQWSELKTIIN